MNPRVPSRLSSRAVRDLTGVSREQFAQLIEELGPQWDAARAERLDQRRASPRQRAPGAGRKPVPFAGRLFLALIRLRLNLPYRVIGTIFGVSKDTVQRAETEIVPLLADYGITAPDGRRVRTPTDLALQLYDLADEDRAALLDGSFCRVGRPKSREESKQRWSHHRHCYAMNFQAVTDADGALLWVGGVGPGNTNDITAIAASQAATPLKMSGVTIYADKGYIGLKKRLDLRGATVIPLRKRAKNKEPLADWINDVVKTHNADISRVRVRVENRFANMKRFQIMRNWRGRDMTKFEPILGAIAALSAMPT
jgi:DDE superfamily endonuclease/Helix-turn-helix of DDE superfamily endonuclease